MGTHNLDEGCTTNDRPSASTNCKVGCIVEVMVYFEAMLSKVGSEYRIREEDEVLCALCLIKV